MDQRKNENLSNKKLENGNNSSNRNDVCRPHVNNSRIRKKVEDNTENKTKHLVNNDRKNK